MNSNKLPEFPNWGNLSIMKGDVRALVSAPNGVSSLLSGYRLSFSPYRLFQFSINNLSKSFCQSLRDYLSKFNLIITDKEGAVFFQHFGVDSAKLVVCDKWLVSGYDKMHSLELIEPHLNSSNLRVLNAMSRFSDRNFLAALSQEIQGHTFEDFGCLETFPALDKLPLPAWIPVQKNIYPIQVPLIDIRKDLDFLVMDLPARNLSLLPNGIAYLETALLKNGINFQILDIDVISYHLFHMHRIFDLGTEIEVAGEKTPEDPWLAHNYDAWSSISEHEQRDPSAALLPIHNFFDFLLEKAAMLINDANPKILGFSVQQCNEVMTASLIRKIRGRGLESPVVVGGFSCYNFDIGLRGFPLADYMCIGEAETTIGNLIKTLLRDGTAKDLAGVLGKSDTPGRTFSAAPMIHNLDTIEFPKYSWTNLSEYVNWDGYQLVPIIASRGCRWSRCTFCAERFYWRIRSASDFVDELEWHVYKGHYLFMFNESDLNGMPERVLEICDEIISRGLHKKVKLTGQLRIHRKSDAAFFRKLRAAGFVALRFGVDSFSRNGMKLQQKGYTPEIVAQNLKDCSETGIFVEVNWVIGVPGETESDIDEGIRFILDNQKYIGRLANLNPLILVNGSVYWLNPSEYEIHFKEPWDDLKKKFPRAIPAGLWWSENPLIDSSIRQNWFHKVVKELFYAGFPIGDWAKQVIDDVENRKDGVRSDKSESRGNIDLHNDGAVKENMASGQQIETKLVLIDAKPESLAKPPSVRKFDHIEDFLGYSIYLSERYFYAVHESLSVNELELASIAIYKSTSLVEIRQQIEDAVRWANTRGTYSKNENATSGNIMKADSNLMRPTIIETFVDSVDRIVPITNGLFFGLDSTKSKVDAFHEYSSVRFARRIFKKLNSLERWDKLARMIARVVANENILRENNSNSINLFSKGASPELVASWDTEGVNIVRFDGIFYAVPQGIPVNFEDIETSANLISSFKQNISLKMLMETLDFELKNPPKSENLPNQASSQQSDYSIPRLIKSIESHNIVGYEGFYYAIPHILGEIDLQTADVVEDERIFRDVSIYAVEDYVLEQKNTSSVS